MRDPKVSARGVNIQILGQWNPLIFVPRWFSDVGLLPEDETDAAKVDVVHEEIAQFEVGWCSLRVTRDRLVAATERLAHTEALRDLVYGTLDLLSHTPTGIMGINHDYLLDFGERSSYDDFGWRLVPQANWSGLKQAGMASLQVQGDRTDGLNGYVRVRVDPLLDGTLMVAVGVNDHYQIANQPLSSATPEVASVLNDHWFESERQAASLVDSLLNPDGPPASATEGSRVAP